MIHQTPRNIYRCPTVLLLAAPALLLSTLSRRFGGSFFLPLP